MEIGPQDIHEKQFHDAWRGYNQEEVDDFLDRIAEALDRLHRENSSLQTRIEELDQAVAASRNTEEMLKKTLVTAQRAAEEAISTAKLKAQDLVSEAEERSRRAAEEATRRTAEAEKQHEVRKRDLEASIERLRAFEAELKQRLKTFLDQQQRALQGLETRQVPTLRATPSSAPIPAVAQDDAASTEGAPPAQEATPAPTRSFSWRPDRS